MKFLENLPDQPEPKESSEEAVRVSKVITVNIECVFCDANVDMEGGSVGDGKAKFLCPECHRINILKWNLDI